ncbi:23S rRNA (cytidine(2498)-2'-O)-methyltransferase RlmM [Marinomonas mediterranea]|uniref:23S rRNA (cytidine(2498)-2'-O)-methyltransferase RlmM n=1 Tax=Marinomonas mediterranea TaxID=119864 RepID=UPI00234A269F|nr:23S rRNA (cytidine(2498)-2'-O)-methyltransferase RlmM [Marinomonas mediterranea]WCN09050.1 23S rRNA (cytidine(2498)-2'-O)-methyltransferase RlmM [Marinomonas mediterranea]
MKNILAYCRIGFEKDCAAELQEVAANAGVYGYCQARESDGYVVFNGANQGDAEKVIKSLSFNEVVFARQLIAVTDLIEFASGSRVESFLESAKSLPLAEELWLEVADTNDGKALSALTKKIDKPLRQAWKRAGLLRKKAVGVRHHAFFMEGDKAYLGVSFSECRSDFPMGIRRLRFPSAGPSRSTLKLEEAMLQFVPEKTLDRDLNEGMVAVDLGAAPGGWSYQFVKRGIFTISVDNGPMQKELMATGLVDHQKVDGFKFQPEKPVDWMVCDMVERPIMVAKLMSKWLVEGWTKRAIFNLKLPMKKRHQEVSLCLEEISRTLDDAGLVFEMQAKHLYHDREEVTVCVMVRA